MFVVNEDNSIYATRGDIVFFSVSAEDNGSPYKFKAGDVVRIKIFGKKDAESVVLQKDFSVEAETEKVEIYLTEADTKIGEVISKPRDYWYEIELNPFTNPQTIIGYDEDGAKVFKLFPEGDDIPEFVPDPEDFRVMDDELDMTSTRPVQNQAVARAVVSLRADFEETRTDIRTRTSGAEEAVVRAENAVVVERARIDNLVAGTTPAGSEVIDVRVGADGKTYPSAGVAVRTQFDNVHEVLNTMPSKSVTLNTSGVDFNGVIEPNRYVVSVSNAENNPIGSSCVLIVESVRDRWLIQHAHTVYTKAGVKSEYYYRHGQDASYEANLTNFNEGLNVIWGEWHKVVDDKDIADKIGEYATISTSGFDINTLLKINKYVVAVSDSVNKPPIDTGYILDVNCIGNFTIQTAYALPASSKQYYRIAQTNNSGTTWGQWVRVGSDNEGMVVVTMGDSITGNYVDGSSVAGKLAEVTGATTYNCGFGGCRMSSHSSADYLPFSMWKLADAIVSGDFSAQEEKAALDKMQTYFVDHVETLKALDFSKVDIVTIGYGTNDFTSSTAIDNADDRYDVSAFGGALRYSIEKLLTAYPNLRIVLVAPTWRYWRDSSINKYLYDSDTHEIGNQKLYSFVEKTLEIAKEYHLPVVNPYDEMGINKFNYPLWFRDGTHPNETGQGILAKLIARTLSGM